MIMMRSICLLLFFISFLSAALPAQQSYSYNPVIDVQHYVFAIELNDLNNEMKANAVISVLFLMDANTVTFDLVGKHENGKG